MASTEELAQQVVDCFASERQANEEKARNKETVAWLVERKGSVPPFWATLGKEADYAYYSELWTLAPLKALKFADKGSAESYIKDRGLTKVAFSSEHVYIGLGILNKEEA